MSLSLEERIAKSKAHTAKLEQQRRLEKRRAQEAEKKKGQRRNYIIGDIVTKYFPELLRFEPGTREDNAAIFLPLATFLSVLSDDQELMAQLKQKTNDKLFAKNWKPSL